MDPCEGRLSWEQCDAFASEFDTTQVAAHARSDMYTELRAADFLELMAPCCAGFARGAPCCKRAPPRKCPIGSAPKPGGPDDVCHRNTGAPPTGASLAMQTWARHATPAAPVTPNWDPCPWASFIVMAVLVVFVVLKFRAHRRTARDNKSRYTDLLRKLHSAERLAPG